MWQAADLPPGKLPLIFYLYCFTPVQNACQYFFVIFITQGSASKAGACILGA
jgi:hypothetical protein